MPFLKGKQSLEDVRSPRGEESKTVRFTGRPVEQQRGLLPTHFLYDYRGKRQNDNPQTALQGKCLRTASDDAAGR
jgi:hypothetical protein